LAAQINKRVRTVDGFDEHGVERVESLPEMVHMRGLLAGMGELHVLSGSNELGHLGSVHSFGWNAMRGFKFSIPLEIREAGANEGKTQQVRWKEGWQLTYALAAVRPWHDWSELRDDAGAVYWRTGAEAGKAPLLAGLQREIEQNKDSKRRLILCCT
jgi:hypothetical protein